MSNNINTNFQGRYSEPLITFDNGKTYQGEWIGLKLDGFGVLTWPDGKKYDGSFRNGMRHG